MGRADARWLSGASRWSSHRPSACRWRRGIIHGSSCCLRSASGSGTGRTANRTPVIISRPCHSQPLSRCETKAHGRHGVSAPNHKSPMQRAPVRPGHVRMGSSQGRCLRIAGVHSFWDGQGSTWPITRRRCRQAHEYDAPPSPTPPPRVQTGKTGSANPASMG